MTTPPAGTYRIEIVFGIAATLVLASLSVLAIGVLSGGLSPGRVLRSGSSCVAPSLAGTVVHVTLTNMGGPMMGQRGGMMSGGVMRLNADKATVASGTVSFLATNNGSISHELVILPLPDSQIAGTRQIGGDAKVDESGSVGEASTSCAAGAGAGIVPDSASWVTVTLPPGRYELICNLPDHYAAGMHTQLTVT